MDKNELIKKMKHGEIGFIDEPEEEKQVWEAFKKFPVRILSKERTPGNCQGNS